jgi:hypothetical protein
VVRKVGPAVVAVTGRRRERASGIGSRFLITPDGSALAKSHVVHGHDRLGATAQDGDALDAELIGHGRARRLSLSLTATVVPLPRRPARALAPLNDRAVQVTATVPGGSDDAVGLEGGDLTVTADGRVVAGVDDLDRVLAGCRGIAPWRWASSAGIGYSTWPSSRGSRPDGARLPSAPRGGKSRLRPLLRSDMTPKTPCMRGPTAAGQGTCTTSSDPRHAIRGVTPRNGKNRTLSHEQDRK